jgi:hypothetical protein
MLKNVQQHPEYLAFVPTFAPDVSKIKPNYQAAEFGSWMLYQTVMRLSLFLTGFKPIEES